MGLIVGDCEKFTPSLPRARTAPTKLEQILRPAENADGIVQQIRLARHNRQSETKGCRRPGKQT